MDMTIAAAPRELCSPLGQLFFFAVSKQRTLALSDVDGGGSGQQGGRGYRWEAGDYQHFFYFFAGIEVPDGVCQISVCAALAGHQSPHGADIRF